jgi:hypothetical protein
MRRPNDEPPRALTTDKKQYTSPKYFGNLVYEKQKTSTNNEPAHTNFSAIDD